MGSKTDINVFKMAFIERKMSGERKRQIKEGKKAGSGGKLTEQGRAALSEIGKAVGGLGSEASKTIDGLGSAAHDVADRVDAIQKDAVHTVKEDLAWVQVRLKTTFCVGLPHLSCEFPSFLRHCLFGCSCQGSKILH